MISTGNRKELNPSTRPVRPEQDFVPLPVHPPGNELENDGLAFPGKTVFKLLVNP